MFIADVSVMFSTTTVTQIHPVMFLHHRCSCNYTKCTVKETNLFDKFSDVLEVRCDYKSCKITDLKSDKLMVKERLRQHASGFHLTVLIG